MTVLHEALSQVMPRTCFAHAGEPFFESLIDINGWADLVCYSECFENLRQCHCEIEARVRLNFLISKRVGQILVCTYHRHFNNV